MDINKVKKSLTNIKPNEEKLKRIEALRESYKDIVNSLSENCNDSRELSIAITKLEESLMWAVKSIILEEN